jgi:hypothetical protein
VAYRPTGIRSFGKRTALFLKSKDRAWPSAPDWKSGNRQKLAGKIGCSATGWKRRNEYANALHDVWDIMHRLQDT